MQLDKEQIKRAFVKDTYYLKSHYWVGGIKNKKRKIKRFRSIYETKTKRRTLKSTLIKEIKRSTNEIMGYDKTALKSVLFPFVDESGGSNIRSKINIRICAICGCDISDRNHSAKYCSKKCSNKATGKKRTARNQIKRNREQRSIDILIKKVESGEIYRIKYLYLKGLSLSIKNTDQIYRKDMPYSTYRRITRVEIFAKDKITLTTMRAKEFIKRLSLINQ